MIKKIGKRLSVSKLVSKIGIRKSKLEKIKHRLPIHD
jgi:hypothetical protein